MDEATKAKLHRSAELEALTSVQLQDLLTGMGWEMRGRQNKPNRKFAVLHLEGHPINGYVLGDLKLKPLGELEQANGNG